MAREIENLPDLEELFNRGGGLGRLVIQGLDLRGHTARLLASDTSGCVFLGCNLEADALVGLTRAGASVFPELPGLPYKPYRNALYTADELLAGFDPEVPESFDRATLDSRIYRHAQSFAARTTLPIMEALAQRLHDHSIDDALGDLLNNPRNLRRVVAIMGGHSMGRDEPAFLTVARVARALTRKGYFIASGGGPGAMEAANLGAWCAPHSKDELVGAVASLAELPSYTTPGYLARGLEVRASLPHGGESLAIPTWFYGHEPTNVFASHVAKYFSNSLREDGLLAIAHDGVIYAPGSAGTIQEVFMDAAQNHYGTFTLISPMVFLGSAYWTQTKPVYPLLKQLAAGKQYFHLLALCDSVEEVVAAIVERPPERYRG